jgi:hypothetical protein
VSNFLSWVDRSTSRRGFLAGTGKRLSALGLAVAGAGVMTGEAQAFHRACCGPSENCGTYGYGCPGTVGVCDPGCTNANYTWGCCYLGKFTRCWDCFCAGNRCNCYQITGFVC